MDGRRLKLIAGIAACAALGLGGAAIAGNGTKRPDDADHKVAGSEAERAGAAAVSAVGEGTATAVERDSDGRARYEVEVTKRGGSIVDVDVDGSFRVIATDPDSERAGDDRERDDADDRGERDDADDRGERDDADDRSERDGGDRDDD
jgi:hypothetical protein